MTCSLEIIGMGIHWDLQLAKRITGLCTLGICWPVAIACTPGQRPGLPLDKPSFDKHQQHWWWWWGQLGCCFFLRHRSEGKDDDSGVSLTLGYLLEMAWLMFAHRGPYLLNGFCSHTCHGTSAKSRNSFHPETWWEGMSVFETENTLDGTACDWPTLPFPSLSALVRVSLETLLCPALWDYRSLLSGMFLSSW